MGGAEGGETVIQDVLYKSRMKRGKKEKQVFF